MITARLLTSLLAMSVSFPVGGPVVFGQVQSPASSPAVDDGSIKGYFLANNGWRRL